MKILIAQFVTTLALLTLVFAPSAHADQGSYLAAAHADPVLAGSSDFWLMVAGSKACAGAYHANWRPAYAAVIRIAHHELCP